ncbi:MAG: hypothetical protein IJ829_08440 [Kiritimatiellae bacterium]|nr:hypothetical protein [Kiritimatiellia bacterium]
MRKKSREELGTLVTREMKVMLQDEGLTKEQRFDVLVAVMFGAPLKNALLKSFAKSLKAGFEQVNSSRYRAVEHIRETKRRWAQTQKNIGYADEDGSRKTSIDNNRHLSTSIDIYRGLKQNKTKQDISPYKPPKGGERKVPKALDAEDLLKGGAGPAAAGGGTGQEPDAAQVVAEPRAFAEFVAGWLEQTPAFGRMRANRRSLVRCLLPLAEKNSARLTEWWKEIGDGLAAWTAAWEADDWQFAPGKITKWLADEKYLQPPRKKAADERQVGAGCGDCGAEIA